MKRVHICTGLLRRADRVLLVLCRYGGEPRPLWTLPGGRLEDGETIVQAIQREFIEETSLRVRPESLAYASESIDMRRGLHVVNCTFFVQEDETRAQPRPRDPAVIEAKFVPIADAPAMLSADVLRIPVQAALSGKPYQRYFMFDAAYVDVPFLTGPVGALDP